MSEVPHHAHHGHGLHIGQLLNEAVSRLAPFSGLILTITTCVLAVIRIYFLDLFFIPKVYSKQTLKPLNGGQLRSFTNHHVAAGTKIILLIVAAYPLLAIICGTATPHTPYAPGAVATLGDVMIVCSQLFTAMYIFELFYRDKVSVISCAHHIGAIVIAQSAIAMSINWNDQKDAIQEFILCFVWGAFDVIAELWPHLAMIVYRTHASNHLLLSRIFYLTMYLELFGTTAETIIVMWLFGSLWDKWALSLKIATPFLHTLFSAAQLWGAWIFYKLAKEQRRKHEDSIKDKDEEAISELDKGCYTNEDERDGTVTIK
ncbi:hypothetical protein K4F52_002107 [Lecanicillium sp. MT-2017a]|nr:hypothetical protein K4F52_002107 [Lecanicillium sp. MT-2017a]